jgi:hypothetical protein
MMRALMTKTLFVLSILLSAQALAGVKGVFPDIGGLSDTVIGGTTVEELDNNVRYLNGISLNTDIANYLSKSKALNDTDLKSLVSGNSILGHICNTKSVYELYFKLDGDLLFRKNNSDQEIHIGKWWVKSNSRFS